jgi:hypothetical protein
MRCRVGRSPAIRSTAVTQGRCEGKGEGADRSMIS